MKEASKKRRRDSEGDNKPKKKKKTTVEEEEEKKGKKMVAKKKVEKKGAKKAVVKPVEKKEEKKEEKKVVEKKKEKKEKEEVEEEEKKETKKMGVRFEDLDEDGEEYPDNGEEYEDDSGSDEGEDDDDLGERLGMDPVKEDDMTEVNVDFEFHDLGEDDYHFVKRFLSSYLDGLPCTELSDFFVKEESVGTAIRVDEACFGFISLVNLHHPRTKDMKCLKAMKDFILRSVQGNKEKHAALADLLNNQKVSDLFSSSSSSSSSSSEKPTVSLIFNERVVNCPEQLALPLHENFWDEINYAVENENDEEEGSKASGEGYFRSEYYIMVSKVSDDNPHVLQQRGKGEQKLGKGQVVGGGDGEGEFLKLEDEIYAVCGIFFFFFFFFDFFFCFSICYILHFTFYILHFTFYILHFTFYILHFTFYIFHFPPSHPLPPLETRLNGLQVPS